MDKEIQANQWWFDMWHERTSPLDLSSPNRMGWVKREGKRKEKKEEKVFRERVSNFSLDFSAIGPAVSNKTRSKVDPHCKSCAWVPILWSFDKLQEVGVFSYLV